MVVLLRMWQLQSVGGDGVSEEECKLCAGEDDVELTEMCDDCRAEVVYLLGQRRAGEY